MTTARARILIVDDEPSNINILAGLLKDDYSLMVARSGELALKSAAAATPPDLILLDIMMPEMDGYEVCRRLKAEPATAAIPVIFISAMSETRDETLGLELGAVDYITKPISPPIVLARVRTHLALQRGREELQAAYAVIKSQKDRMQEELNVGREIQMSMMPLDFPGPPQHPELAIHATLQAAREVGGDFYDYFFIDRDHFALCIGDVSGKGVPAALLMAVTKTLIKASAGHDRSTGAILTRVNDTLAVGNENAMFVTLFLAICDLATGDLVYTNASHNPPYLRRADGRLERLDRRHGLVVGGMDGIQYRQQSTRLAPGDGLLLYTDGVTEAANAADELFSEPRLVSLLEASDGEPQGMVEGLTDAVDNFAAGTEQADDITLVAFRYIGGGDHSESASWTGLGNAAKVADWFDRVAEKRGIAEAQRRKLQTVLDDLIQNILCYAWPDRDNGTIELSVRRGLDGITLLLRDDGIAFDPLAAPAADTGLDIDARDIGGLGLLLIRETMDELHYQREAGHNCLHLRLAPEQDADDGGPQRS